MPRRVIGFYTKGKGRRHKHIPITAQRRRAVYLRPRFSVPASTRKNYPPKESEAPKEKEEPKKIPQYSWHITINNLLEFDVIASTEEEAKRKAAENYSKQRGLSVKEGGIYGDFGSIKKLSAKRGIQVASGGATTEKMVLIKVDLETPRGKRTQEIPVLESDETIQGWYNVGFYVTAKDPLDQKIIDAIKEDATQMQIKTAYVIAKVKNPYTKESYYQPFKMPSRERYLW